MIMQDNGGRHIHHIVASTACTNHAAPEGYACWGVDFNSAMGIGLAVCGSRIRSAGFVGKISATSMQLRTPGGRAGRKN